MDNGTYKEKQTKEMNAEAGLSTSQDSSHTQQKFPSSLTAHSHKQRISECVKLKFKQYRKLQSHTTVETMLLTPTSKPWPYKTLPVKDLKNLSCSFSVSPEEVMSFRQQIMSLVITRHSTTISRSATTGPITIESHGRYFCKVRKKNGKTTLTTPLLSMRK